MKRSTITRISGGSVQSGGFRTFDLTILPKNEPNGTPARHARVFCCPQEMIVRVQSTGPEWKVEVQETAPREAATAALRHLYREHGKPTVKRHAPLRLYAGAKRYRLVGGGTYALKIAGVVTLLSALAANTLKDHQELAVPNTVTWAPPRSPGEEITLETCDFNKCTKRKVTSTWAPDLMTPLMQGKEIQMSTKVSAALEILLLKDDDPEKVITAMRNILQDESVDVKVKIAAQDIVTSYETFGMLPVGDGDNVFSTPPAAPAPATPAADGEWAKATYVSSKPAAGKWAKAVNAVQTATRAQEVAREHARKVSKFETSLRDSIEKFLAGVQKAGTEATAELDWGTIHEWALNWGIGDIDQEIGIYVPIVIRVAKERGVGLGNMPVAQDAAQDAATGEGAVETAERALEAAQLQFTEVSGEKM